MSTSIENRDNSVMVNNTKTDDRISELPEGILSHILSFLTLRDAAKASVLSPTWRYLCASTSKLSFDLFTVFGKNDRMGMCTRFYNLRENKLKFVKVVDQFLQLHRGPKIDSFRVCYCLGNESACHIDRWISFAVRMRTEKLELDFFFISQDCKVYNFPCHLLPPGKTSQLKHLSLKFCILRPLPDFTDRFNSLKTLDLTDVPLDQNCAESILSACINLEWLRLEHCSLPVSFCICGQFVRLKFLVLDDCHGAETFELSSVSLTTFEYIGGEKILSFVHVPWLGKVHLNFRYESNYMFNELAKDVSQLQILSMVLSTWKAPLIPENMSTFSHLKQLELFVLLTCDFDLLSISFILNGSPHLQKFHLGLYQDELVEFQIQKKEYTKHIYHQLKEIEISGFSNQWIVMELAIYLLNNAVSLERMIVDSRGRLYDGNGRWWNRDSRMGGLEMKRVYDVLVKEKVKPSAELIIL